MSSESEGLDQRNRSADDADLNPESAYIVSGELLRSLINNQKKSSRLQRFLTHPLLLVIVSGAIGAGLTDYYVSRQQKGTRSQSFLDGINNARVPKIGEVWEQLDVDELAINELLEGRSGRAEGKNNSPPDDRIERITKLIKNDQILASKYRFWLGEDLYRKTEGYLDLSIDYALKKIGSPAGTDLTALLKKRDAAKQDILQIRKLFLQGELDSEEQR